MMPLFLLANWKWLLIGGMALVFSITVGVLKHELKSCSEDKAKISSAYTLLSLETTKQTESINRLGEAAKQAKKAYLQAVKKTKPIVGASQKKIASVGAISASPKAIHGECAAQMEDLQKLLGAAR